MADERRRSSDRELGIIITKLSNVEKDIDEIKTEMKKCYVSKEEFNPIKRLVYGAVGVILTAVLGAIVAFVIRG